MLWERTFDGGTNDKPSAIIQTDDGGFALAAQYQFGVDVTNTAALLIRLDAQGQRLWTRKYILADEPTDIIQLNDGGFAVVGFGKTKYDAAQGWMMVINRLGRSE